MIGSLLYLFTGKKLVLYNQHRQTIPIVENRHNRKSYIFLKDILLWKLIPLSSQNKYKFKFIYVILTLLNPRIILDINWINKKGALYHLWAKKNRPSLFMVVQHGSYIGGIITDNAHKYAHCDVFLTWGDYFTKEFKRLNSKKNLNVVTFGNPVLNCENRSDLMYRQDHKKKILIAPSGIKGERLRATYQLIKNLEVLGFEVFFRPHRFQNIRFESLSDEMCIDNRILRDILLSQDYDFIVSDHSSILIDAIYFKNFVVYFSAPGELREYLNNNYTKYLCNTYFKNEDWCSEEAIYQIPNAVHQEKLLDSMIFCGNNLL